MNENKESKFESINKWLRVLICIAAISLINSAVNFLPFVPTSVTTWISRGIMAAMVICMFQFATVNARYQKAGIFRAVMLGCTLITAFLYESSILTLVASILSVLAVYQEYSAHSELVAEKNPKLSRKWHSLFNWSILAAVLIGFGSVVAVLIVVMLEMDAAGTASIIVGVLSVPQFVINVVYLLYLKKMIQIFRSEGEGEKHDV